MEAAHVIRGKWANNLATGDANPLTARAVEATSNSLITDRSRPGALGHIGATMIHSATMTRTALLASSAASRPVP